jgi:hypothetical protein
MARVDDDGVILDDQAELIPRTPEELQRAGLTLARLIRDLEVREADEQERRKDFTTARDRLRRRIADIAASLRSAKG